MAALRRLASCAPPCMVLVAAEAGVVESEGEAGGRRRRAGVASGDSTGRGVAGGLDGVQAVLAGCTAVPVLLDRVVGDEAARAPCSSLSPRSHTSPSPGSALAKCDSRPSCWQASKTA